MPGRGEMRWRPRGPAIRQEADRGGHTEAHQEGFWSELEEEEQGEDGVEKGCSDDEWEGGSSAGSLDVEEALEWWGVDDAAQVNQAADEGEEEDRAGRILSVGPGRCPREKDLEGGAASCVPGVDQCGSEATPWRTSDAASGSDEDAWEVITRDALKAVEEEDRLRLRAHRRPTPSMDSKLPDIGSRAAKTSSPQSGTRLVALAAGSSSDRAGLGEAEPIRPSPSPPSPQLVCLRGRARESEDAFAAAASTSASSRVGTAVAAEMSDMPLAQNVCARCGKEALLAVDVASAHGVLFCCELAGLACDEAGAAADAERPLFLHCCAICGEARALAMDFAAVGLDFRCGLVGLPCTGMEELVQKPQDEECVDDGGVREVPLQRCVLCGAEHAVDIDLEGLGVLLECALLGRRCWDMKELLRPTCEDLDHLDRGGSGDKAAVLRLVEQQRLLGKLGVSTKHEGRAAAKGSYQPELERAAFIKSLELQSQDARERFRDGAVVSYKGEKFVMVGAKASPGRGSELAGIIGSSSRGRLGLGLRKMTKEEAEKFALSNKERGHVKKKVAHARNERETVQFETKKNMHQLTHAATLPASVVR